MRTSTLSLLPALNDVLRAWPKPTEVNHPSWTHETFQNRWRDLCRHVQNNRSQFSFDWQTFDAMVAQRRFLPGRAANSSIIAGSVNLNVATVQTQGLTLNYPPAYVIEAVAWLHSMRKLTQPTLITSDSDLRDLENRFDVSVNRKPDTNSWTIL